MTGTFRAALMITGVAAAAAGGSPASAGDTVAVGELTCSIKGGSSFIFGSTRELLCTFKVRPQDQGELYEGVIRKYGLDAGITNTAILAWTVLAPTNVPPDQGAVMGRYIGIAADASVGLGGGANILVGGSNNTISLQPVSIQGQTGINAALGVAEVELVPYHEDH
jgi:hypothetical protein